MDKPIAIDLFCGAGGMSEGLIQAGFHIVFSSDINEDVEKTYTHRHEQLGLIHGKNTYFKRADIRHLYGDYIRSCIRALDDFQTYERIEIDAIFGGPPCQGFSRAGRRDPNDPRNLLFKHYLRLVSELRPKYVVLENVEGFFDTKLYGYSGVTGVDYGAEALMPDILLSEFERIGYPTLEPQLLDAADFGVPQRRRRAIFIAYREGVAEPRYPEPTTPEDERITVLEALGDLIVAPAVRAKWEHQVIDSAYQRASRRGRTRRIDGQRVQHDPSQILNGDLSNHYAYIRERFSLFRHGEDASQLHQRVMSEGVDLAETPHLWDYCHRKLEDRYTREELREAFLHGTDDQELVDVLLTKKNSRLRLSPDDVAPTVLTLPDDHVSPFEDRIFSVREMARLQSFDDSFEFKGKRTTGGLRRRDDVPQYSQVGNAVPPLLARAIAEEIRKAVAAAKEHETSESQQDKLQPSLF